MRIDHVLRPVVAIGLVMSREAVRTVTEYASHVLTAVSAMGATVGGTGLSVLTVLTTTLIGHVGSVVFGVVAILASIVTAVVPEVLTAETVVGFEVVLRVFGNWSVGELPVAGSRSDDWALLRLSVPADITGSGGRHCCRW